MLTIQEICRQTGLSIHTFHSWRRGALTLLPQPIGVSKKTIFFDDSIVERINYILAQREAGKNLHEIEALLEQSLYEDYDPVNDHCQGLDDGEKLMDAIEALKAKWEMGNPKNEICLALKLDPKLTGLPLVYPDPRSSPSFDTPLVVYATVVSNGYIYLAELWADLTGDKPQVVQNEKIKAAHYAMFVAQLVQKYLARNRILEIGLIPGLLFNGAWGFDLGADEVRELFSEAEQMTKILKAGQEFVKLLS